MKSAKRRASQQDIPFAYGYEIKCMVCLLLNADAAPISIIPLSVLTWQEAIKLVYLEVVDAIHYYEDWIVHSPSVSLTVPSVIMLRSYVKFRPYVQAAKRGALFLRDEYKCLYCLKIFPENELTIDHVIPRSHGGGTNWRNCVTACYKCNMIRGNDTTIRPARAPYQPTHYELVTKRKRNPISVPDRSWIDYLGWSNPDLICVRGER